jgi:hypothetical protein
MHQGKAIIDTAKTYPNLPKVILEVVQNSIDSSASRIVVSINISRRQFVAMDNGNGCSKDKFQKALVSINNTMKTKDKYGQFGRGLVSPLSVAQKFDFVSCPSSSKNAYATWQFDAEEIVKQYEVEIPGYENPDLNFDANGKTWWRTKVEASKLTTDRQSTVLTLQGLHDAIALKFGEAIRERDITVTLTLTDSEGETNSMNVTPQEFSGDRIGGFEYEGKDAGKVTLELYIARLSAKGRKGKISFGTFDNPSRISAQEFVQSSRSFLNPGLSHALISGTFEGKIFCKNIKLHADRDRFEENDALVELCSFLEAWFETSGKKIAAEAREKDTDDRYQRIGASIMPFLEYLLRQSQFKSIADAIKIGTIGKGHADVRLKNVIGPDKAKSVATGGSPFIERDGPGRGIPGKPPKTDHPKHSPGIAYGPKGQKRTEVKGSTGLRLEFVEMEDINIPFAFDPTTGTLSLNLDHPDWSKAEETDETSQKYQSFVATAALTLELSRDAKGNLPPEIVEHTYRQLSSSVIVLTKAESFFTTTKQK